MAEDQEPELPRGLALVWGVAATPQRGPKREMSVERIVEAAMAIADAEGLTAVSMSAVAARLGFTTMSLYRYVSAKDDLIQLMQEEAVGVPPASILAEHGWRARLEAVYRTQVALYARHPWALDIPITGAPATPNSAAWMDLGLEIMAEGPLEPAENLAVVLAVTGHARWAGMVVAGYVRAAAGRDDQEMARHEDALYRGLITPEQFPALRAAIDAGVFLDEADAFAFGLERLLDGVEAYLRARAVGAPPSRTRWQQEPAALVQDDRKVREAQKAVRVAERALRDAQARERQAVREATQRLESAG